MNDQVKSTKRVVWDIITQMQYGYPVPFFNAVTDDGEKAELGRRFYALVKNIDPESLEEAYRKCVIDSKGEMPTIPQIATMAYEIDRVRKSIAREKEMIDRHQQKQLPSPDAPVRMPPNIRAEWERILADRGKVSLEQRYEEHKALIKKHYKDGKIKKREDVGFVECCYGNCPNAGVLSHSVRGAEGRWYCPEHFKQMA